MDKCDLVHSTSILACKVDVIVEIKKHARERVKKHIDLDLA